MRHTEDPSPHSTACSGASCRKRAFRLSPMSLASAPSEAPRSEGPFLRRHYPASTVLRPSPTPEQTADLSARRWSCLHPPGPPPITQNALRTCCSHYPDGPNRCAYRLLPGPCCLPRYDVGSASAISLSGPAQDSLALRPARLLPHLSVRFVTRLRHVQLPKHIARQLPALPTTGWVGSSPTGVLRRWGAHHSRG